MTQSPPNISSTQSDKILEFKQLHIETKSNDHETKKILKGLSLSIKKGQTVALLGESGSGKSLAAYSVLNLLPPGIKIKSGQIKFNNQSILELTEKEMRKIRGNKIGMIFQEPGTSLNPLMPVGKQIGETLKEHRHLNASNIKYQVLALMDLVGIADPLRRYNHLPHQLSGGARQRIVIAMALACKPELLLADEPTSALDATVQAQIIDLLDRLITDLKMSVFLISHNMGIIAALADRVAILYKGLIIEEGPVSEILKNPAHPYTMTLLQKEKSKNRRNIIVKEAITSLNGCPYASFCNYFKPICSENAPGIIKLEGQRMVRCFLHGNKIDEK